MLEGEQKIYVKRKKVREMMKNAERKLERFGKVSQAKSDLEIEERPAKSRG